MAELTVPFHRITCDHPGCTVTTEPCRTLNDAKLAFWADGGMLFLPGRQYRCADHHHPCKDGRYYPFPADHCPRCRHHA